MLKRRTGKEREFILALGRQVRLKWFRLSLDGCVEWRHVKRRGTQEPLDKKVEERKKKREMRMKGEGKDICGDKTTDLQVRE